MKKSINLITCLSAIILVSSCVSSKTSTASKRDLKGTWTLTGVTYMTAANETVKISLFDDADINCFTGSTWVLPSNGYGSYTINSNEEGCNPGTRDIIWSYDDNSNQFQFKKLTGDKAKNIDDGYRLTVASSSDNQMVLQSPVSFAGGNLMLNYNFSRQ